MPECPICFCGIMRRKIVCSLKVCPKHPLGGTNAQVCAVKSENDKLSDTQRLWIHVLSSAGVKVELCHAVSRRAVDVKGEIETPE